jgi:hypothetical protein
MLSVVDNESNPATRPRLADVKLRLALLLGIHIQRRNAVRVLGHRREESAFAGADFEHVPGERQGLSKHELETRRGIVAEASKQRLASPHGALAADGFCW